MLSNIPFPRPQPVPHFSNWIVGRVVISDEQGGDGPVHIWPMTGAFATSSKRTPPMHKGTLCRGPEHTINATFPAPNKRHLPLGCSGDNSQLLNLWTWPGSVNSRYMSASMVTSPSQKKASGIMVLVTHEYLLWTLRIITSCYSRAANIP